MDVDRFESGLPTHKKGLSVRLRNVPTPMAGLALGIASLGGAWSLVMPDYGQSFQFLTGTVASVLVLALILKFITNPNLFREDLAHPVAGSVLPACAMTSMVIAQSLLPVVPGFARGLWLVAVFAHILLFISFAIHRLIDFRLHHMVPSWFVPPVGIIVAALTSAGMGYETMVYWLFWFGLGVFFFKLPIMLYRLIFSEAIPQAALPTFAIMGAPASLSLAGYLTITDQPDYLLIAVLLPLAIFMTALVYVALIRLLRLPFSPGYASFTFPMVVGATALFKVADVLLQQGHLAAYDVIHSLANFELLVATGLVAYVAMRFLWFYFSPRQS